MAENKEEENSEWEGFWTEEKPSFSKKLVNFARKFYFSKMIVRQLGSHKGKTVLEAGSGSCESLIPLSRKAEKVVGLDNSKNAIKLGYKNFRNSKIKEEKYRLVLGDIFHMPFPDNSFDLVFNAGVIEHFDSIKPIEEMIRVTKNNEKTIILVPAKYSPYTLVFKILKILGLRKLYPWEDHKFYTKEMMKKELVNAGAQRIKVTQPLPLFGIYIKGVVIK